jgi:hypothetical protein
MYYMCAGFVMPYCNHGYFARGFINPLVIGFMYCPCVLNAFNQCWLRVEFQTVGTVLNR